MGELALKQKQFEDVTANRSLGCEVLELSPNPRNQLLHGLKAEFAEPSSKHNSLDTLAAKTRDGSEASSCASMVQVQLLHELKAEIVDLASKQAEFERCVTNMWTSSEALAFSTANGKMLHELKDEIKELIAKQVQFETLAVNMQSGLDPSAESPSKQSKMLHEIKAQIEVLTSRQNQFDIASNNMRAEVSELHSAGQLKLKADEVDEIASSLSLGISNLQVLCPAVEDLKIDMGHLMSQHHHVKTIANHLSTGLEQLSSLCPLVLELKSQINQTAVKDVDLLASTLNGSISELQALSPVVNELKSVLLRPIVTDESIDKLTAAIGELRSALASLTTASSANRPTSPVSHHYIGDEQTGTHQMQARAWKKSDRLHNLQAELVQSLEHVQQLQRLAPRSEAVHAFSSNFTASVNEILAEIRELKPDLPDVDTDTGLGNPPYNDDQDELFAKNANRGLTVNSQDDTAAT
jgi:uncharacterized protein YdcH (DUF465 family)